VKTIKHLITCTSEELAILVTLCDYPDIAKGIAEVSLGKMDELQSAATNNTGMKKKAQRMKIL